MSLLNKVTTFADVLAVGNLYHWTAVENWSNGLPANGDTVIETGSGVDDIASLSLAALTLSAESLGIDASLTVTNFTFSPTVRGAHDFVEIDNGNTLTVQGLTGAGQTITAVGAGSTFADHGLVVTETFAVSQGGVMALYSQVSNTSTLDLTGGGTIELFAASGPLPEITGISYAGTLEVPGTRVSSVTFGTVPTLTLATLQVVTDAGTYQFSDVTYAGATATNFTYRNDPVSNLVAITFRSPDVFSRTTAAAPGVYDWSTASNWSEGVPVAGDTVVDSAGGSDNIASLSLGALTATAGTLAVQGTLNVSTLTVGGTAAFNVASALTIGAISGSGATFTATGAGAAITDSATVDPGETYVAASGGMVAVHAAVSSGSTFDFSGAGTIALFTPGSTTTERLDGLTAAATLELPGTAVLLVSLSNPLAVPSLTVTTSAGTYSFTNVGYAGAAAVNAGTGFDAATGLATVTFRGTDVFSAAGGMWSNAAGWSEGVPVAGDAVTDTVAASDDIASLSLGLLTITGTSLAVHGTLSAATVALGGATLHAYAAVTIQALSGAGGTLEADGAGGTIDDQATLDPGETYAVSQDGTVRIHGALSNGSTLDFGSGGDFALFTPAATIGARLKNVGAQSTLELAGTALTGFSATATGFTATTDAGTWSFTNVAYAAPLTGVGAHVDAATGLLALVFDPLDGFLRTTAAASGALAGQYLWSNAANWTAGVPNPGDAVTQVLAGTDDLANLSLLTLTMRNGAALQVSGGELDVGTLNLGTGTIDVVPNGSADRVVIGKLTVQGGVLEANGSGAALLMQGTADPGNLYEVAANGLVSIAGSLVAATTLQYAGIGDITLLAPQTQISAALLGVAPGDTLELPGSSVSAVTLGATSITVTTSAGTYSFTNVQYGLPVAGYTATPDGSGEVAIAFAASDTFQDVQAAASGPLTGNFLWSDAANWSGGVPASGGSLIVGSAGFDDIANLSLAHLVERAGGGVVVTGRSLTVTALGAASGNELLALGAGTAASVTVGGITGTGGLFGALGASAVFNDTANTDAGATYVAQSGGTVELSAAPAASSKLEFNGQGTFELTNPAATSATAVTGIVAGDRLELPGITSADLAPGGTLTVATSAGTETFSNLAFAGGVTGVSIGQDAMSGLATLTFTDQAVSADLNGDGTSDQLWQASTGALIDYAMRGGSITGAAIVGSLDATYKFLAAGDFHGDGTADQLWQASSGAIVDFAMQNGAVTGASIVGSLDSTWRFLAAADFNGDGTTDQLWRAGNGAIVDFSMQNGAIAGATGVGALDATWTFLAAADFNGDGTADQLWQAANGTVVDYAMNNGTISSANVVGAFGAGMKFLAAADFNGDGRADMLWQNTATGGLVDYTMNGAAITATATVGTLDGTWKFLAAGDFNGDGTADQLWQNAGGAIVDFTMRNGAITGGAVVGTLDGSFKFLA